MTSVVTQAKLDALQAGIATSFTKIQAELGDEVYGEVFPVVGSALASVLPLLRSVIELRDALTSAISAVSSDPGFANITTAEGVRSALQSAIDARMSQLSAGLTGTVAVSVNSTTGDVELAIDSQRAFVNQPFALSNLGMASIGLNLTGTAATNVYQNIDLRVGVDTTGYYVDKGAGTNLDLGIKVDLGAEGAFVGDSARLGPLKVNLTNNDDSLPGADADTMNLTAAGSWVGGNSGKLRDFSGDVLTYRASGGVDLDLHLRTDMGDATMPELATELRINWLLNNALLNGSGGLNNALSGWGGASVTFDDLKVDLGSFVMNFLKPTLDQVELAMRPIQEALDVFRTDITDSIPTGWRPSLDKINSGGVGRITYLDFLEIAKDFSPIQADIQELADLMNLLDVIEAAVLFFRDRVFADSELDFGDFTFTLTDVQNAITALAGIVVSGPGPTLPGVINFLQTNGNSLAGFRDRITDGLLDGNSGAQVLIDLLNNTILDFPIIENAFAPFTLLLGGNVDLFSLNLPEISIGLGIGEDGEVISPIPIVPTLPLDGTPFSVTLNAGFQMSAQLSMGYDTQGLRDFATGNYQNPNLLLNGFWISDQRLPNGTDLPEFEMRSVIEVAFNVDVLLASATGGANIMGTTTLDIGDFYTADDGLLRYNELPVGYQQNPFLLFDASGVISAGVRFSINSIVGNLFQWDSPRITLSSFVNRVTAPDLTPRNPAGLGDLTGTTLMVNIGTRANQRDIANKIDGSEIVEIGDGGSGRVTLTGFNANEVFGQSEPLTAIRYDAGAGNDEVYVTPTLGLAITATGGAGRDVMMGGAGDDRLEGGTDSDWVQGGGGDDQVYGDEGDDYLSGGAGADRIEGGDGFDVATYRDATTGVIVNLADMIHGGDALGDRFFAIDAFEGSNHDDQLIGLSTKDTFFGLDGNDDLQGRGGDDVLVGGLGANTIDGGTGHDLVSYYFASSGVTVTLQDSATGTAGTATQNVGGTLVVDDTLTDIDEVQASPHADTLTGGAGRQVLLGMAGNDTIDGGAGDDLLFGGVGGDTLRGGDGIDTASYALASAAVTLNLATGGTGGEAQGDSFNAVENVHGSIYADTITGDGLANQIEGNDGDDTLNGAGGNDILIGSGGIDTLNGGDDDDILIGGVGGDALNGNGGVDIASYRTATAAITLDRIAGTATGDAAGDSFVSIEGYEGSDFNDTIRGTNQVAGAIEHIRGGGGDDGLDGAGGDDVLDGGSGIDTLTGGAGADRLIGGAGNDSLDGGADRDIADYSAATGQVYVNLSTATRTLLGVSVAGLTARDGLGGIDGFVAAGGGLSSVEDARGGAFADSLVASEAGSILEGLGGSDGLRGLGGNDILRGGDGTDALYGGGADDVLDGGEGSDLIDGESGANDMASWESSLSAVNASLATGTASDGLGGTDTLFNIDGLRGSAFGDTLTGDGFANRIEGLAGNDVIDGGALGDTLVGGRGDDIYYVDVAGLPAGNDVVVEVSGEGSDLVRSTALFTDLAANVEDLSLLAGAFDARGNDLGNRIMGNHAVNLLDGLGGSDTFWGYGGDDTYVFDSLGDGIGVGDAFRFTIAGSGEVAGGGSDTIRLATAGIYGGTFLNPTLWTYDLNRADLLQIENIILIDPDRRVDVTGNALDNRITGSSNGQILRGEGGDDTIDPGTGRDTVSGGTGFDTLTVDWSSVTTYNLDFWDFRGGLADGYFGHWRSGADATERNLVVFDGIERFVLTAGAGDDHLHAGDGNDILTGNGGSDLFYSRGGVDIIDGGDGVDLWNADKGAATAAQPIVIDLTLPGVQSSYMGIGTVRGIERLELTTGAGDDRITTLGSFQNDTIITGAGSDIVKVAAGRDSAALGEGFDTLIVDWSAIADYDLNFWDFRGSLAEGYFGHWRSGADATLRNYVGFSGVERFEIKAGQGADHVLTGDGNDIIDAGAGNDLIYSRKGVDMIEGGAGVDLWNADKGDATAAQPIVIDLTLAGIQSSYMGGGTVRGIEWLELTTGAGDDRITTLATFLNDNVTTGAGSDIVKVVAGRDSAVLGEGIDTLVIDWSAITDYDLNFWDFRGSLAEGYFGHWRSNADATERNYIGFNGVERFEIRAGQGNDALYGGDGDDIMFGNAGNDFIESNGGADQIDGGAGTADRWFANKSAATVGMAIDLAVASTYTMPTGTGSVVGIEALGLHGGALFSSGAGDDTITTLASFLGDFIATNGGTDRVTLLAGRDVVLMGGQPAGTVDTLVVDWSAVTDTAFDFWDFRGSLNEGYFGHWRAGADTTLKNRVDFDGVERFELKGGQLGDALLTGDGNDIVLGNAGDDVIYTRQGIDIIDGGDGIDLWNADKSAATAAQPIVIDLTLSGIQSSYMGSGTVRGIERLELTTGAGDDRVTTLGLFLVDTIITGAGNDIVKVVAGRDRVSMGAGIDTLIIDWSAVADYDLNFWDFRGSLAEGYFGVWRAGADTTSRNYLSYDGVEHFDVKAGQGHDTVATGDGDDIVFGNAGDDYLQTGKGVDRIDGGAGTSDRWLADKSAATAGMAIDLAVASTYAMATGTGTVVGVEALGLHGGALFQTGSGDDTITTLSSFLGDFISTNGGADRVSIFAGRDVVVMGGQPAGTVDTLVIDWSAVTTYALDFWDFRGSLGEGYFGHWRAGGDTTERNRVDFDGVERFEIKAGQLGDAILTGDGNDIIFGNAGDDVIYTRQGVDIIDGGDGVDLWNADKSAATAAQAIVIDLTLTGIQSSYMGSGSVRGIERIELTTGAGHDRVTTLASFLNDSVVTGAGDDIVRVAAGRDGVTMGSGNDLLVVDWSSVTDYAFDFWDFRGSLAEGYFGHWRSSSDNLSRNYVGFDGVERFDLRGGAMGDWLLSGDGNDALAGNGGNDLLIANGGNDLLDGGAGDDTMRGGAGDDIYIVDALGDVVEEAVGAGVDEVRTTLATYTLAANVENLTGIGTTAGQTLTGHAGNNVITGGSFGDTLAGAGGDDFISGGLGNDVIDGGTGNDILVGGGGGDAMTGGAGNDTFLVDSADSVFEDVGGGIDTIFSLGSFILGAGSEVEELSANDSNGTFRLDLTGNAFSNRLYGNAGVNVLNGGGGADIMVGFAGDDTYLIDNVGDQVLEAVGGGHDIVFALASFVLSAGSEVEELSANNPASTARLDLTGNEFANRLYGNAGVNVLNGGGGADFMAGYGGDDTYLVDVVGDQVFEMIGGGYDIVFTLADFVLTAGSEIEELSANNPASTARLDITGNEFANRLYGNAGVNVLNGGGGADMMHGFGGNDFYLVDTQADQVFESAGGGYDTIYALVSYFLAPGVEIEELSANDGLSTSRFDLGGNEFANALYGNAGTNVLYGGDGSDLLTGGGGADLFVFNTTLAAGGIDRITDFQVGIDKIALDDSMFVGLSSLSPSAFVTSSQGAQTADNRIIYDSATGALYFDPDGNGSAAAVQFATLGTGLAITVNDFLLI